MWLKRLLFVSFLTFSLAEDAQSGKDGEANSDGTDLAQKLNLTALKSPADRFLSARLLLEGYGTRNYGQSNTDFGRGVFNLLSKSFPNDRFFVAVYGDKNTEKGKRHTHYPQEENKEVTLNTNPEASYFYFWKHAWNRNVVLVRQGTKVVDHSAKKVYEACGHRPAMGYVGCGRKIFGKFTRKCDAIDCVKWVSETRDCLKNRNLQYVALGCFHGDNYRAATFDYGYVTREDSIRTVNPNIPHAQYIVY